jgi:hypothetical protein
VNAQRPLPPRLLVLLAAPLLAAGCNLDITRTRVNVPLDQEAYRRLEVGRTTLDAALKALGAPDKVETKPEKDYLWWIHQDTSRVGVRLSSPTSVFGYRHTFAEVDVNAEDTSAMRLVFDRNGLLEDKSLRLSLAYREEEAEKTRWSFFLMPRFAYSLLAFGDGGEKGYGSLFPTGQLYGGHLGILPAPYFTLLLGGNFQTYEGDSFWAGSHRAALDDLRLYQVEAGGRFSVPPAFFVSFWDIDKLKALFYSDDMRRRRGLLFYFQWTVGATYNEEVGASIDGVPRGTYFDRGVGLSSTMGTGIEYNWSRLGAYAGIDYQVIDTFETGNAPLDTDAGGFQNLMATAGLSVRF